MQDWKNKLCFGDNLDILRNAIKDESVDLIYLDPPFNSNATYNILYKEQTGEQSPAQIMAFEDTWHWGEESEKTYHELMTTAPQKLTDLVQAFRSFLGTSDMMAYLAMMAPRLLELHRVLKPTGSVYLHCDPTASHYLKLLMDAIFGARQFRNEIVWCYSTSGRGKREFSKKHDTIFFYSKSDRYFWNDEGVRIPYSEEYIQSHFKDRDEQGRVCRKRFDAGKWRIYYPESGMIPNDWWTIPYVNSMSNERLGYPTQKPQVLLERIIKASSKEDDVLLDPFCGCGTAIATSEHLQRRWIGIDITHLAITLIKHRLCDAYDNGLAPYEVIGDPKDVASAAALAQENRYQFEWWALGLVDARPSQDKKKGADKGVDGYINFFDDNSGKAKHIIVQVKSGHVSANHVRDLKGVLHREHAEIGVLVTLEQPTKPMLTEATTTGWYTPASFPNHQYPRLQVVTIGELLNGTEVHYPRVAPNVTFLKAVRQEKAPVSIQERLFA
jgi:site-specific DNA-methyltransferase (adenine-specific)